MVVVVSDSVTTAACYGNFSSENLSTELNNPLAALQMELIKRIALRHNLCSNFSKLTRLNDL